MKLEESGSSVKGAPSNEFGDGRLDLADLLNILLKAHCGPMQGMRMLDDLHAIFKQRVELVPLVEWYR